MKILVTGGSGFIGSHLIRKLIHLNHRVVNLDHRRSPINQVRYRQGVKFYLVDINHQQALEKVFQREQPKAIYHLAAKTGVRESLRQPQTYFQTNVLGTLNLLEAAVKYGTKDFFFTSSSSVYGQQKKSPFHEDSQTSRLISPYAVSKRSAELLIEAYHYLFKLRTVIFRLFTVYGPHGREDMAPFLFTQAISRGQPLKKFGSGQSQRDYVYIDDVINGLTAVLDKKFNYAIINLGSGQSVTLNYLIRLIEKLLNKKAQIEKMPKQVSDLTLTAADIGRAAKLLHYQPKTDIKAGMKKFIDWYLANEQN